MIVVNYKLRGQYPPQPLETIGDINATVEQVSMQVPYYSVPGVPSSRAACLASGTRSANVPCNYLSRSHWSTGMLSSRATVIAGITIPSLASEQQYAPTTLLEQHVPGVPA